MLTSCLLLFFYQLCYFLSLRDSSDCCLWVLSDIDLLLSSTLVNLILGLRYLFDWLNSGFRLAAWDHPALLVLLDPAHLIMLTAVGTLPLLGLHLMIVTLIAYLIFAITRIELLLDIFEVSLAHVADIIPSNPIALAHYLLVGFTLDSP